MNKRKEHELNKNYFSAAPNKGKSSRSMHDGSHEETVGLSHLHVLNFEESRK